MAFKVLSKLKVEITEESVNALTVADFADYMYWLREDGGQTLEAVVKLDIEEREAVLKYLGECALYEELGYMKKRMFENIYVVAAVNSNRISEQDIKLLQLKYGITDMEGCLRFCSENNIDVYKEEEHAIADIHTVKDSVANKPRRTPEETYRDKLAKKITRRIMHLASVKARKRARDAGVLGWLCGTYTSRIAEHLCLKVGHIFSVNEMEFIVAHLDEENDDDIAFNMIDSSEQEICNKLNTKLNELIPMLHMNIFYSDYLD